MNEQKPNNFARIIEIIILVISELQRNKTIADIDVNELQAKGYTSTEISTAFSWLADRVDFSGPAHSLNENAGEDSFRILHEVEQDMFTSQAWGEMIQLHSLGILGNDHIESIIERAFLSGVQQVDSRLLKSFVAMSVFNASDDSLFGSRLMLNGDESIN